MKKNNKALVNLLIFRTFANAKKNRAWVGFDSEDNGSVSMQAQVTQASTRVTKR